MIEDPKLTLKILKHIGSDTFPPIAEIQEIYSAFPNIKQKFLKHHVIRAVDAGLIRSNVVRIPVYGGIGVHINPIAGLTPEGDAYIRQNRMWFSPGTKRLIASIAGTVIAGLLIIVLSKFIPG